MCYSKEYLWNSCFCHRNSCNSSRKCSIVFSDKKLNAVKNRNKNAILISKINLTNLSVFTFRKQIFERNKMLKIPLYIFVESLNNNNNNCYIINLHSIQAYEPILFLYFIIIRITTQIQSYTLSVEITFPAWKTLIWPIASFY